MNDTTVNHGGDELGSIAPQKVNPSSYPVHDAKGEPHEIPAVTVTIAVPSSAKE